MRGSAAIEQLSFNVLAVERDQQDEDNKLYAQLRSLKCRITGETGEADRLKWWNVRAGPVRSGVRNMDNASFDPHEQQEDTKF
jgi:hypothetical protein